jgi:hypothetical protein
LPARQIVAAEGNGAFWPKQLANMNPGCEGFGSQAKHEAIISRCKRHTFSNTALVFYDHAAFWLSGTAIGTEEPGKALHLGHWNKRMI